MNEFQDHRFRKVLKELFATADELQAQMADTRAHCKQIEEVMIAIRQNYPSASRTRVLPKYPLVAEEAANDEL